MKALFLYPSSNSARFTAGYLLENGFDVVFYCPEALDVDQAEEMIAELTNIGWEQDEFRNSTNSFLVEKGPNLTDCEMISKYTYFLKLIYSTSARNDFENSRALLESEK